jgi:anti-sigma factor RsiW
VGGAAEAPPSSEDGELDMKCEHCRKLLDEYVEGLLMPLDRASLETHLAGCARCTVEAQRLATLVDTLRELPEPDVPEDLVARVMAQLPEMLPAREGAGHLVRWGLLAAAATLAFVAGLAMLPQAGGPEVARDTLAPLAASLQLGGSVLAHAFSALASVLDATASELASTGLAAKLAFAVLLVASNAALAVAVHRYRDAWLRPSASLGRDEAV